MTNEFCAYCGRHVPNGSGDRVGVVRFCSRGHWVEWISLPQHDRRQSLRAVAVERMAS